MKHNFFYIAAAIISLLFLVLTAAISFTFIFYVRNTDVTVPEADTIYVYVSADIEDSSEEEKNEYSRFIKTYNGRIGIYDETGVLLQVIDVYTKTLPMLDQDELQEGFWIETEKELYSIIEAYSD